MKKLIAALFLCALVTPCFGGEIPGVPCDPNVQNCPKLAAEENDWQDDLVLLLVDLAY